MAADSMSEVSTWKQMGMREGKIGGGEVRYGEGVRKNRSTSEGWEGSKA